MSRLLSRMPRRWARLGAVAAATCALGVSAVGLLLREEEAPPARPVTGPRPAAAAPEVAPTATPGAPALAPPAPAPPPPRPTTIAGVAAARAPTDLAAWVTDRTLEPRLRYTALRRLETEAPAEAVTAALAVLDDLAPLVRLNAIALLTRAQDLRAHTALAQLDDRSRRLAGALARR